MFKERPGVAALIALTAAGFLAAAPAHGGPHKGRSNGAESSQAVISADRAAAIARSATGGRVLNVQRRGAVYRVRVLLDGERVRNVSVDARTGRVLN
jgi:uncharacterized membrane protein YkoI